MESMSRASWTDERLEDFARNTERRFDEVNHKVDDVVRRMDSGFNRVDADIRQLRSDMNARFDTVDTRLHALQRTMVQTTIGMAAIVVTALVAVAG
ncbi:MAG TPA: hypothetical protein VNM89_02430 [Solirubrobacterales bacterium]|nr:hypothetical protein [Solirubrobacterales bacterium]